MVIETPFLTARRSLRLGGKSDRGVRISFLDPEPVGRGGGISAAAGPRRSWDRVGARTTKFHHAWNCRETQWVPRGNLGGLYDSGLRGRISPRGAHWELEQCACYTHGDPSLQEQPRWLGKDDGGGEGFSN